MVYVLIEVRRQFDTPRAATTWTMLSDLYAANQGLFDLIGDRRKSYAAELMLMAWRARQNNLSEQRSEKPSFLSELERRLIDYHETANPGGRSKRKLDEIENPDPTQAKKPVPSAGTQDQSLPASDTAFDQIDFDSVADMDFDAIDWSFWEMAA